MGHFDTIIEMGHSKIIFGGKPEVPPEKSCARLTTRIKQQFEGPFPTIDTYNKARGELMS